MVPFMLCSIYYVPSQQFPFIGDSRCQKLRTSLYHTLSKLLFTKSRGSWHNAEEIFTSFVRPIAMLGMEAGAALAQGSQDPSLDGHIVGFCRDLTGIMGAASTRQEYRLVFEWFIPTFTDVLRTVIEACADKPMITNLVLKLMADVAHNRAGRIVFPQSSTGGLVLFRESAKIIITYGRGVLQSQVDVPSDMLYSHRFKGIAICLKLLTHLLTGGYVNFGIFEL